MRTFRSASDGVDPGRVPVHAMDTGARMPAVGLGTFGSDRFTGEAIAEAVKGAAEVGYRHFDCAAVYGNERLIGQAFRDLQSQGLSRDRFWVTSKLWNDKHGEDAVIPACENTLKDLQLDYLDLYLIHWPFPNYHAPGVSVDSRDPHARPYLHARYMKTWRQMERLVRLGLVRHIGTSNMTRPKLALLLRDARDQAGRERDGVAPALPAARAVHLRGRARPRADRLLPDRLADAARARQDAGGHRRHRRSGHRPGRREARGAPGGGLRQMGRAARPGAHPVLGVAGAVSREPQGRGWRPAHRGGDGRPLPAPTGAAGSSRGRSSCGRALAAGRTCGTRTGPLPACERDTRVT